MKTAIIWNGYDEIRYAIVDGDWSTFQGIYIGSQFSSREIDLSELMFADNGRVKIPFVPLDEFVRYVREGATVIECGVV